MTEGRTDISPTVSFKSTEILHYIFHTSLRTTQHNPSYVLDVQVFNHFVTTNLIHKPYRELNLQSLILKHTIF